MKQLEFDFDSVTLHPKFIRIRKRYVVYYWSIEATEWLTDDEGWDYESPKRYSQKIGVVDAGIHESLILSAYQQLADAVYKLDPRKHFNIPDSVNILNSKVSSYTEEWDELVLK